MSDDSQSEIESTDDQVKQLGNMTTCSRRGALALLGTGGLSAFGSPAAADHKSPHWQRNVDANGNHLFDLGSLSMTENPTEISNFEGENLSIDHEGDLNADVAGGMGGSGDKVLLFSRKVEGLRLSSDPDIFNMAGGIHVPFDDLLYENITQIYVSATGLVRDTRTDLVLLGLSQGKLEWYHGRPTRISDEDVLISGSEIEITEEGSFKTPKVPFDSSEPALVDILWKGNPKFYKRDIHVWGEIE